MSAHAEQLRVSAAEFRKRARELEAEARALEEGEAGIRAADLRPGDAWHKGQPWGWTVTRTPYQFTQINVRVSIVRADGSRSSLTFPLDHRLKDVTRA